MKLVRTMKFKLIAIVGIAAAAVAALGLVIAGFDLSSIGCIIPGLEPHIIPGLEPHIIPGLEPHIIPGLEPHIIPGLEPH